MTNYISISHWGMFEEPYTCPALDDIRKQRELNAQTFRSVMNAYRMGFIEAFPTTDIEA